jgi:hypothetical protein
MIQKKKENEKSDFSLPRYKTTYANPCRRASETFESFYGRFGVAASRSKRSAPAASDFRRPSYRKLG